MALIINGKMPDACWDCDYRCGLNILGTGQKKHECCPIIGEIPDKHGRLIDVDGLMKKVREEADFPSYEWSKAIECLEEAQTIVEATE